MKVVHLIGGGDVGGAKTHVLYLLKELGKYIDVKLISLRPGAFADDARAMGIDVEVVKSGNIFRDIKKVAEIISHGGYNIIHSHGAKANMFSLAARRYTRLPTVTTVHSDYKLDYMHSLPKRLTIGLLNTIALRFIGNYIAVSNNFRAMLAARNFNPANIYVLYNGMDFSEPTTKYSKEILIEKYNLPINESNILVGIAARLYPVKSIDTIIRAAALVKKENPNIKFLIGGDGEDRKMLEDLTESLNLRDTVYFLGWLDDPNEVMSNVDISVLTSISESFPYSILEGARFKKATISSNVGGIPDLIKDGVNGYLFEPGDYKKLSQLILKLGSDPELLFDMGKKIYEKAVKEFSKEKMCETQLAIYRKILEKSQAAKQGIKYYDAIISGYYGFSNIGDDALLMSIIKDLRKYKPDVKILVLSRTPLSTSREYNVDSISRQNPYRIFRAMKKSRAFIYGGGNLLQDNTSTRSLFFYLGTVWLASRMKLKIMFYANGIGPLQKKINRLLTRKIMNKVDVITLREKLSFSELKNLHISKPNILLTADAALTVDCDEYIPQENKPLLPDKGDYRGYIGFSLRKYPGNEFKQHDKYESVLAYLADHMCEKHRLLPVFIPMQHPDDLPVLRNVAAKMKHSYHIISEKLNVCQTYEIISKMDMMVAMRLHALVFSAASAVPMVGLVYDPKIEGFLEYINQPSAGDVRYLELDRLIALTEKVMNKKDTIRKELQEIIPHLKEKARENARIAIELISGKM